MSETVREQIMKIRDTGLVNMCDMKGVQIIAFEMECYELVNYIEEHKKEYWNFIIKGE